MVSASPGGEAAWGPARDRRCRVIPGFNWEDMRPKMDEGPGAAGLVFNYLPRIYYTHIRSATTRLVSFSPTSTEQAQESTGPLEWRSSRPSSFVTDCEIVSNFGLQKRLRSSLDFAEWETHRTRNGVGPARLLIGGGIWKFRNQRDLVRRCHSDIGKHYPGSSIRPSPLPLSINDLRSVQFSISGMIPAAITATCYDTKPLISYTYSY